MDINLLGKEGHKAKTDVKISGKSYKNKFISPKIKENKLALATNKKTSINLLKASWRHNF